MIQSLVTAEITGADIPATLDRLTQNGLTLHAVVPRGDLTIQVTLHRQEFTVLKKICGKTGDRVKLIGHRGTYWMLKEMLHRPLLLLGFFLMLLGTLYLPSKVLFVQVEGNQRVPEKKILEMAAQCGIRFGASRRAVRSERMKNALLETAPELQWAGVNTRGCVAVILVRERMVEDAAPLTSGFGHIVALSDAMVTACTATRGTLLCTPGQAVTAGQILISGYTDSGLSIRAEMASGEIYGQTRRSFRAVTPTVCTSISKTGAQMKKISIILGKKRINLWKDSGIWDATCDRMYEEYYITLPGGYPLPLVLAVERYGLTDCAPREIPSEYMGNLLTRFAEHALEQTMIAGTIRNREVEFIQQPGIMLLAGEYRCTELIGVMQRFQIGEENGKNH